jgi:hypothetical protein
MARFGSSLRFVAAVLTASLCALPQTAPETAGPSGETLDYAIEWRLIPAGTAKFAWTGTSASSQLTLKIDSGGLVSRLFKVDDLYTATLGENLCAQSTTLIAHEGPRDRDTRVTFDAAAHKAMSLEKDLNKNTTTPHEVEIPPCVHDVVSALMVLRRMALEPGKSATIPVSDGKKFVQVRVEAQRREDLHTPRGTVKTIRYEAFLFDNILFRRSGHLHIWLTDDEQHLPVQLQVKMSLAIGTITLRLEKDAKT